MSDHEQAAVEAAAAAIDAEYVAADGRSRLRWSRDLAIAAVDAARKHLATAEAELDHCPGCAHRYGTCPCECCAHVARAVAAERERIVQMAERSDAIAKDVFHPYSSMAVPFADLIRQADGA